MSDNDPWRNDRWVDYFNSLANPLADPETDPSQGDDDDNNNGGGGKGGGDGGGGDGGDENDPWRGNQIVDEFNRAAKPQSALSQDDDDNGKGGGGHGGGGDGNPGGDPGGSGPGGSGGGKDDDGPDKNGPDNDGPNDGNGPGNGPTPPSLGLDPVSPPPGEAQLTAEEEARLEAARDSFYARYLDDLGGERTEEVESHRDEASDYENADYESPDCDAESDSHRGDDAAPAVSDQVSVPGHDFGRGE